MATQRVATHGFPSEQAAQMRSLRRTILFFCLLCLFFFGSPRPGASHNLNGQLIVRWNVPVTGPQGGHLDWYEIKADPENENNLIVCGGKRNAQDNAYYGVVYSSHDGGRSWKEVLEDRSSSWVSEQSCAFGSHMAYFISEASKVIDGRTNHELGTTRIFVSYDAGETWTETATTGWADDSNSVVSKPSASNKQRLYVFYNGNSHFNAAKRLGSTLDFFTVSEDGATVSQRRTVPGMAERNYQGVYPSSSMLLSDGTPIVLYEAVEKRIDANGIGHLQIGAATFPSTGPSKLSIIANATGSYGPAGRLCPGTISDSLAYDRKHNLLYVAYNDLVAGRCMVMLTESRDEGRTWSKSHELHAQGTSSPVMYFPILTVNQDGVLGLLWDGKPKASTDCWYFSISRDAQTLADTRLLAHCYAQNSLREQSSAYLDTVAEQAKCDQPAHLLLLTRRDYLQRIGITTTPDGVFHPLWSTLGNGFGDLRTARIQVNKGLNPPVRRHINPAALEDVTDRIVVLYGGEQRLDHDTNSVMVDISFRNRGSTRILGPLYLHLENASSDFGIVSLANPAQFSSLGPDFLDLSSSMPGAALDPGEETSPYQLTFHFQDQHSPVRIRYFLLKLKLRLFRERPH